MKKPKIPVYIANAIQQYSDSCDRLARMFLEQLGMPDRKDYDWWWIDYPAGGMMTFNAGELFIAMEDIILAVEHAIGHDEFMEWYWQWNGHDFETGEPNPGRINMRSWLMGARPETIKD